MTSRIKQILFCSLLLTTVRILQADFLELTNGDRITGHIVSMNEHSLRFKTNYGTIDIPRKEIVTGAFGTSVDNDTVAVNKDTAAKAEAAVSASRKEKVKVPADGLILECLFDGYIRDSSGSGHTVKTVNNVFLINGMDGKANTALLSDGTGTYAEIANSAKLEALDSFTLSCWFLIQAEAGNQYLVAKWETTSGQKADGKFALSYAKGNLYFYIVDENGYFQGLKQEAAVTLQTWNHIAASYNKGKLRLYFDGEKLTEKEVQAKGLYKEKSPVTMMTAKSTAPEGWAYYNLKGRLDNVRIYNRELSPDEIRLLYLEGGNG